MAVRFNYKIIKDYNLIICIYNGDISLNDIKQSILTFSSDDGFTHDMNIISDISSCTLKIHPDELPGLISFLNKTFNRFNNRREAILTSGPNEVAISMLYSQHLQSTPLKLEVFSTIKAALKSLMYNRSSFPIIEKYYYDFRNEILIK